MRKKGEILMENLIFLILNIAFLTILIIFLMKQGSGYALLEETTSKQIALIVDSASPGMVIRLDMEKAMKISEKNNLAFSKILNFENNYVFVKISEKGGYEYPFFNKVKINAYPETDPEKGGYNGIYVLTISRF